MSKLPPFWIHHHVCAKTTALIVFSHILTEYCGDANTSLFLQVMGSLCENFDSRTTINLAECFLGMHCSLRFFLLNSFPPCPSCICARHYHSLQPLSIISHLFILHQCFPPYISCKSYPTLMFAFWRSQIKVICNGLDTEDILCHVNSSHIK